MAFYLKLKANEIGIKDHKPNIDFSGRVNPQRLIEIFVESYYIFFGKPNAATFAYMSKYADELDGKKELLKKDLGIK